MGPTIPLWFRAVSHYLTMILSEGNLPIHTRNTLSAPDPVTTSIVTTLATNAGLQIAKQAQDFISAVSGHKGDSIGTIMGELLKRRTDNGEKVWGKAGLILLNLALKPDSIELPILQPAIDASTLAENPTLQQAWANLLANAADPRHKTPVMPIFTSFLKDLGPREVQFLDKLYGEAFNQAHYHRTLRNVSQMLYTLEDLENHYVNFGLATVTSLRPMNFEGQQHPDFKDDTEAFWVMLDIIQRHNILRELIQSSRQTMGQPPTRERLLRQWHFSDLGSAFIKACRPPAP